MVQLHISTLFTSASLISSAVLATASWADASLRLISTWCSWADTSLNSTCRPHVTSQHTADAHTNCDTPHVPRESCFVLLVGHSTRPTPCTNRSTQQTCAPNACPCPCSVHAPNRPAKWLHHTWPMVSMGAWGVCNGRMESHRGLLASASAHLCCRHLGLCAVGSCLL